MPGLRFQIAQIRDQLAPDRVNAGAVVGIVNIQQLGRDTLFAGEFREVLQRFFRPRDSR